MFNRFLRLLIGLIFLCTLPVSIVVFLILWVITGKFYLTPVENWLINNKWEYDE